MSASASGSTVASTILTRFVCSDPPIAARPAPQPKDHCRGAQRSTGDRQGGSRLQSASTTSAHHTVSSNIDTNGSQMTQIQLTVGDQSAIATLADNPTAGDFADLLPVTLKMSDLHGTEKPGALPRPLNASGAAVFTYEVGQIGYWAPGQDVAVVYAVEGNGSIPSPGLIPLGTVISGLPAIAAAGASFQLRIERVS